MIGQVFHGNPWRYVEIVSKALSFVYVLRLVTIPKKLIRRVDFKEKNETVGYRINI